MGPSSRLTRNTKGIEHVDRSGFVSLLKGLQQNLGPRVITGVRPKSFSTSELWGLVLLHTFNYLFDSSHLSLITNLAFG
jgi:hypothetical protein